MNIANGEITLKDMEEAYDGLKGVTRFTPLEFSEQASQLTKAQVYLKLENMQRTGSFKLRGAYNKIRQLAVADKEKGVIAASAGNHAQGVAFAARKAGIPAVIVMPQGAPLTKVVATKSLGAEVVLFGDVYDAAYERALYLQDQMGATFVHAFNDPQVIAGQGTIALEMLEQISELDKVIVPVGGGGLISGVALALKMKNPRVKVIGVQAAGAPAMKASHESGVIKEWERVSTIADGIAVKRPGDLTFSIIHRLVDDIVTVPDKDIAQAILFLLEKNKIIAEGAGAVGLAAVLTQNIVSPGEKVGVIISGGNIDINIVSQIIEKGLVEAGRYVQLKTLLVDKPGALNQLLSLVSTTFANIIAIKHDRIKPSIPLTEAEVILTLETRDSQHIAGIIRLLKNNGYEVEIV